MHEDYVLAARELERTRTDLHRAAAAPMHERLTRLGEVGRLLAGPGLVADATAAVLAARPVHAGRTSALCSERFCTIVSRALFRVHDVVRREFRQIDEEKHPSVGRLRQPIQWQGETTEVRDALRWLRSNQDWRSLQPLDIATLTRDVWPNFCNFLVELSHELAEDPQAAQRAKTLHDHALRVLDTLDTAHQEATLLMDTARALDHTTTHHRPGSSSSSPSVGRVSLLAPTKRN